MPRADEIGDTREGGGTSLLAGRYALGPRIGAGAVADVFRAMDTQLDRPVAIKVLRRCDDEAFRQRFRRESRVLASLHHRNVVQVYDCGESDDQCWMVLEHVHGRTLREELDAGEIDAARRASLTRQLFVGLAAAHDAGLVHRDIKPDNLLVERDDTLRIADFGLARLQDGDTITEVGTMLGTALYMSPEQAAGRPVDARSDLYSAGVVAFELHAGRPPFQAATATDALLRHQQEEPPRLADIAPEASPRVARIVDELLRKDPDVRPASASAVLEALDGDTPVDVTIVAPIDRVAPDDLVHEARMPPDANRYWDPPDLVGSSRDIAARARRGVDIVGSDLRAARERGLLAPVIAALLVALLATFVVTVVDTPRRQPVPDFRGASAADARREAAERGFELRVLEVPAGRSLEDVEVVDQSPSPGSRAEDGERLDVRVRR